MARSVRELRAAVAGTGFIGAVHVEALRRLGVEVLGVCASTAERAEAKGLAPAYESYDALLADERVDVVHITTPNHLHHGQVRDALAAGKHVVCEKPLATTSAESGELLELADRSGLVHCTNFNLRFYPIAHEARARVASGALGDVWNVHGGYLQDWLLYPTDWNWRLDPEKGGALRAVADIGSHWMDLAQWVTGRRIESVFADLTTTLPVRQRPAGEVETFAAAEDMERIDAEMTTEDVANLVFRLEGGCVGAAVLSQVSAGRKNALRLEVDGSAGCARLGVGAAGGAVARPSRPCERDVATQPRAAGARCAGAHHAARRPCRGLRGDVPRALPRGLLPPLPKARCLRSPTFRPSPPGTARTCSATRSSSPTENDGGWR